MTVHSGSTAPIGASAPPAVWRPVQFLGSKLRALHAIEGLLDEIVPSGGTVWDAFTGSSVVAQAVAQRGARVVATDAMAASVNFATAMLGISAQPGLEAVCQQVVSAANRLHLTDGLWAPYLTRERRAIERRDPESLLTLARTTPQRWRSAGASPALRRYLSAVDSKAGTNALEPGLLSATYASSYFGIGQALRLDALRLAIDLVAPAEEQPWQRAACLTALCAVASKAVYSAGKHFAQPHKIPADKDLTFHSRRLLFDRRVDIDAEFISAVAHIAQSAQSNGFHHSEQLRVEQVTVQRLRNWSTTVAYLDPPYTAQQYSRYYHVLDTLVTGVIPSLQRVRGQVTTGLYPEGRYLSPFSSRRQAGPALRALVATIRDAGASAIISYSGSAGMQTGNARMIDLPTVTAIVEEAYGRQQVRTQQLALRYRQFNNGGLEVHGRDDPEFLIVGRI